MKKVVRYLVDFPSVVPEGGVEIRIASLGAPRFVEYHPHNAALNAHQLSIHMEEDLDPQPPAKGYVKGQRNVFEYTDTILLFVETESEFDADRAFYWLSFVADHRLIHVYEQVRT